jgi:hypothetical protein
MRQLLLSLVIILVAGSLAVVGTYAGYVDTETTTDNVFQTASTELVLENPLGIGESEEHGVLRTWHYENDFALELMEPGDVVSSHVYLHSFGRGLDDYVDIRCINLNSEPDRDTDAENAAEDAILGEDVPNDPGIGTFDKDTVMIITGMSYHTMPIIWGEYNSYNAAIFTDTSGDGRISLDEFEAQGLHDLTPVPDSGVITFMMTVKFADGIWNEYQGDRTNMTLIFTLMK